MRAKIFAEVFGTFLLAPWTGARLAAYVVNGKLTARTEKAFDGK